MNTSTKHFARKGRQLRYLLKQIQRDEFTKGQALRSAIRKISRLSREISSKLGFSGLRKLAGAGFIGLFLCLSAKAKAQTFGPTETNPFLISEHFTGPLQTAIDINGDGLKDLFGGGMLAYYGMLENEVQVWLNSGTSATPVFNTLNTNPNGISIIESDLGAFQVADWDDDGDLDILYSAYYDNINYLIENIGSPTSPVFADPVEETSFTTSEEFYRFVDLDADGDLDLVSSGYYSPILCFENTGTPFSPNFVSGFGGVNLFEAANDHMGSFGFHVFDFADLDADGDLDMYAQEILWNGDWFANFYVENIGTPEEPQFDTAQDDPFSMIGDPSIADGTPVFMDTDNDGDQDIFMGATSTTVSFEENLTEHPSGGSWILDLYLDEIYVFGFEDFIFNPDYPEPFWNLRIMELPNAGTFQFYGQDVTPYQFIPVSELQSLSYQPKLGEFGQDYATIQFKVGAQNDLYSLETYSINIQVDDGVSTKENKPFAKTSLQPNPTSGDMRVEMIFEELPEQLSLQITDLSGKLLREIHPEIHQLISLPVSLNDFPSGMYLVRVISGHQSQTHTFVKH